MIHRAAHTQQAGFTLVVMAALFVAFSVVLAVVIENNTNTRQVTMNGVASDKLRMLAGAILQYRATHSFYPCPALLNTLPSDVDGFGHSPFGDEVNNGGSPALPDCSTADHNPGIDILTGSTEIIRGMVPVQALAPYGIVIDDAFDPWGDRIMYIVNRKLTRGGSSPTVRPVVQALATSGASNYATGPSYAGPDFILISYGRDKIGGYPKSATTAQIPCNTASTAIRFENCNNDANFTQAPFFGNVNASVDKYFDDIITFYRQ